MTRKPSVERFWTYMKHQRSAASGILPLKSEHMLITDPAAKEEVLNVQFSKAFGNGREYADTQF